MNFLQRLNERDLKRLAIDRNVGEPVRLAARKFVSEDVALNSLRISARPSM